MAESRIERLRPHWKLVALGTALSLVGIVVAKGNYTSVQLATDPADLAAEIDGETGRTILAAVFDLVFALGYGTLGLICLHVHARGRALAAWAALAVVVGVVADEAENLLVIANAAQGAQAHEKAIDAMMWFGWAKWVAQIGLVIAAGFALLNWLADRRERTSAG